MHPRPETLVRSIDKHVHACLHILKYPLNIILPMGGHVLLAVVILKELQNGTQQVYSLRKFTKFGSN